MDRRARRLVEPLARRVAPTRVRALKLQSPAGYALPCRLHLPPDEGPWPGVLLIAGGLDGAKKAESAEIVVSAQRLARAGFAAMVFSPSGRDDAPGVEDKNGPLHQEEGAEALRLLLSLPEVRAVSVLSISYGLVLAMGALTRHPELAERVQGLMDWEGPGSRRWFLPVGFAPGPGDEVFWRDREAAVMAPRLRCPYHRVQSRWDHVHGPQTGLALEMLRAASGGDCPQIRLNGAPWLAGRERWASAAELLQREAMVRWLAQG